MPIRDIQRRHAELGRIRLGYKAETDRGRSRPAKLQRFRFTSPSEGYIRDLAGLYGGDARPWDNGGKPEWEVFTEAASIPVIAVKGGLSQWMETWSAGGGCVHRCDGEQMVDGTPCDQDTTTVRVKDDNHQWVEISAHDAAKPTTRLAVMLPELDAIGVWRLESHGWNAAAELPTVAELAQFVGQLVPAELHLVERRAIKDGQTSRFVVPVLDLRIGAHRLREIAEAVAGGAQLEAAAGTSALAIEAPSSGGSEDAPPVDNPDDYADWREQVREASSLDELGSIWRRMVAEKLVGTEATMTPSAAEFVAFFKDRGRQVPQHPPTAAGPDADGIVDAELVPDQPEPAAAPTLENEDPNVVWQTVLARAGQLGMTSADLEDDFASRMGGLTAAEATAAEMRAYLAKLEEHAR